jgi:hypothetical protein
MSSWESFIMQPFPTSKYTIHNSIVLRADIMFLAS